MSADPMPEPRQLRRSHNHLDQARREPGECPACDDDWQHQAAHVKRLSSRDQRGAHGEVDALIHYADIRASIDICQAIALDGHHHVCDLPPRHRGHHHCPQCHTSWSALTRSGP